MYTLYVPTFHFTGLSDRPCIPAVNDPLYCVKAVSSPDRLCDTHDEYSTPSGMWELQIPDKDVFEPTQLSLESYHPGIDFNLLFFLYGHNQCDADDFFDIVFSRRNLTNGEKRELCAAMEWDIENLDWHVDHARLCVAAALGYAAVRCGDVYLILARRLDDFEHVAK